MVCSVHDSLMSYCSFCSFGHSGIFLKETTCWTAIEYKGHTQMSSVHVLAELSMLFLVVGSSMVLGMFW